MKRTLTALAILVVPFAGVGYGLLLAWRYLTRRDDVLTAATMRQIHRDSNQADMVRALDEIPRGRRRVVPEQPSSGHTAFSREVPRG